MTPPPSLPQRRRGALLLVCFLFAPALAKCKAKRAARTNKQRNASSKREARRKKKHDRGQPAEHNKMGKEATEAQEEKRERTAGKAQHKGQGSNRSTPSPSPLPLPFLRAAGRPLVFVCLFVYFRACEVQGEESSEKRIAKGQHKERSAKKE
jgi:hypothetical protein